MAGSDLGQAATDFATQLAGLAAIVAVEITGWSAAMGATTSGRKGTRPPTPNWRQGMAMGFLKPGTQLLPVQGELSGLDDGWLAQRGLGIDGEIPVMGMLLAEIIAGQDLRFPLGKNLLQLSDDVFQFLPAKVFAEPQDESCYFLQGGGSPWNFVPFDWSQSVATSPPFAFPVKPKAWLPACSNCGNRRAVESLEKCQNDFPKLSTALGKLSVHSTASFPQFPELLLPAD